MLWTDRSRFDVMREAVLTEDGAGSIDPGQGAVSRGPRFRFPEAGITVPVRAETGMTHKKRDDPADLPLDNFPGVFYTIGVNSPDGKEYAGDGRSREETAGASLTPGRGRSSRSCPPEAVRADRVFPLQEQESGRAASEFRWYRGSHSP